MATLPSGWLVRELTEEVCKALLLPAPCLLLIAMISTSTTSQMQPG